MMGLLTLAGDPATPLANLEPLAIHDALIDNGKANRFLKFLL
jgi:hypothetical protein